VAEPDDPFPAMMRGALRPTVIAAAAAAAVGAFAGLPGLTGALLGAALVIAFFGAGLWLMRLTRNLEPSLVMAVVLVSYVAKVMALGVVLVLLKDASWLSVPHLALSALACTAVWLGAEIRAFTRLRVLAFDPAGPGRSGDTEA
jgi:ATP synthase protein I